MKVVLSPEAQNDLDEIWEFSARRWGDAQAERYVRDIWLAVERISHDPRVGSRCDDVRVGYRKYGVGSHVLFYRELDDKIDIVRILHARMDFDRHL
jgi:toxin ParE1/3/4